MPTPAAAAEGIYGYPGHVYDKTGGSPTGEKPESKLWYNDGRWWASMLSPTTLKYHIYLLDQNSDTWTDTGTALDDRPKSRADTLWDGRFLYVASHVFAASSTNNVSNQPSRLYRYTYDPNTRKYALSAGFPVLINNVSSETLTIDKDSSGRLWATWTQAQAVHVTATTTDDRTWLAPFVLPAKGSEGLAADDISAVAAFGASAVGIMWSNQAASAVFFAIHSDGADARTWEVSKAAIQGPNYADDHINLKALEADASGRVFAAVKTELELVSQDAPQILVLARDPATGEWDSAVVSRAKDCHTRPVVVIDREQRMLHVFATAPDSGCPFSGSAGTIFQKSSPLDAMSFELGRGTPVIRDPASPNMNNVTTTKQSASSNTGMVLLATDNVTKRYWHADLSITPAGTAPDTTGPKVVAQRPAPNATGVPVGTTVQAQFDEDLDPASVTGSTVSLTGPDGTLVPATVGYDNATRTATLVPSAKLAHATGYTATLSTGLRDLAGNPLASAVSWSFTTETASALQQLGSVSSAKAVTTTTIQTTRTAQAGSRLLLGIGYSGTSTTTATVVDSGGNTWHIDHRRDNGSKTGTTSVIASTALAKDLVAGSTLKITFSASVGNHAAAVFEYTGLALQDSLIGRNSGSGTSAAPVSGTVSASIGCGVAFAVTVWNSRAGNFHEVDASSGFVELVELNPGTTGLAVSSAVVESPGVYEHRGQLRSSVLWTDSLVVHRC